MCSADGVCATHSNRKNNYSYQKKELRQRGWKGLDGRVWGHWNVRRGAFGVPAKREGARSQWRDDW